MPFLGVPLIRVIVFGGLYWGPHILGNYCIGFEDQGSLRAGNSNTTKGNSNSNSKSSKCGNSIIDGHSNSQSYYCNSNTR